MRPLSLVIMRGGIPSAALNRLNSALPPWTTTNGVPAACNDIAVGKANSAVEKVDTLSSTVGTQTTSIQQVARTVDGLNGQWEENGQPKRWREVCPLNPGVVRLGLLVQPALAPPTRLTVLFRVGEPVVQVPGPDRLPAGREPADRAVRGAE